MAPIIVHELTADTANVLRTLLNSSGCSSRPNDAVRSHLCPSRAQFALSGLLGPGSPDTSSLRATQGQRRAPPCLHGTGPPPEPPARHRPVRRAARFPFSLAC